MNKVYLTQCVVLGFRGSRRAGNPVPLPGHPDPPSTAPDPHDEWDFEVPDTRSLLDAFMAKLLQSVDDDYHVSYYTVHYMLVYPKFIGFDE